MVDVVKLPSFFLKLYIRKLMYKLTKIQKIHEMYEFSTDGNYLITTVDLFDIYQ